MPLRRVAVLVLAVTGAALAAAGQAGAAGGNYVFDGGTRAERAQVVAALKASSFDWSIVPARITIHIAPGHPSAATPGEIWIDARLLAAKRFAWGVLQHEYAHEVDYFVLTPADRATLMTLFGVTDWCYGVPGLPHAAYGCERFASSLAWAYWPSPLNSMRPSSHADEAGTMSPSAFRSLLGRMLAG